LSFNKFYKIIRKYHLTLHSQTITLYNKQSFDTAQSNNNFI